MADEASSHEIYLQELSKKAMTGEDSPFLEIIKEFPTIYNRGSIEFKDRNIKQNAWNTVSELMKTDKFM